MICCRLSSSVRIYVDVDVYKCMYRSASGFFCSFVRSFVHLGRMLVICFIIHLYLVRVCVNMHLADCFVLSSFGGISVSE